MRKQVNVNGFSKYFCKNTMHYSLYVVAKLELVTSKQVAGILGAICSCCFLILELYYSQELWCKRLVFYLRKEIYTLKGYKNIANFYYLVYSSSCCNFLFICSLAYSVCIIFGCIYEQLPFAYFAFLRRCLTIQLEHSFAEMSTPFTLL